MNETLLKYVKFVEETIEKYSQYSNLISNANEITPQIINEALGSYSRVFDMLLFEYYRKKAEHKEAELDYSIWWAEKFNAVRSKFNDVSLPGTKWLSKNELETETIQRHKDEYKEWQFKLFELENETSLLSRKIDAWKKMDNILVNISLNTRSELKSLSLENRFNNAHDVAASSNSSNVRMRKKKPF